KKIDAYLERNVVRYSSQCVTVSTDFANLIGGSEYQKKFTIIPNGYDHMDIADISQNNNSSKFSIAYAGKLNPQQNPLNLWRALKELIENEDFAKNFQLIFIGIIDDNIKAKIIELGLNKYTYFTGYLPHKEAISVLSQSTVLLLINPDTKLNKGIVPGKLFEYLVLKKFIISISSKGSKIEQILNQTNSGKNYSFSDSLKDEILLQYTNWKKKIKINPNLEEITKYSRKNLTAQLAEIMESLV
ncbi:MAG: glycosyltransferase, partial [Calditrichia bacterium]|nr:glycosyltransferase [Calditrichia bacterium]